MKNAKNFLEGLKIEINDFIDYNGFDFRLKFEIDTVDEKKGIYTLFNREIDVQVFSRIENGMLGKFTNYYYEESGEVEEIGDYSEHEVFTLLKDYIEENF